MASGSPILSHRSLVASKETWGWGWKESSKEEERKYSAKKAEGGI